jgi:aspartate kinase
VAKFGGSLVDPEGRGIPKIIAQIRRLRKRDNFGPIAVFSAPTGFTDKLIQIGESYAQGHSGSPRPLFNTYRQLAMKHANSSLREEVLSTISALESQTQDALNSVNKRFNGSVRARVITFAGELASSALMEAILNSNGIEACALRIENWPIITDDNFEDATPNYALSREKIGCLTEALECGKVVSMAGFLGVTSDGLETVLGRGGSDLTAVFVSCLLRDKYEVQTLLYKDVPIQSVDPKVVVGQPTDHVPSLTYNEAHKASMMGMKIVQNPAIAMARRCLQPLLVVPIDEPDKYSIIQNESNHNEVVKCLTGKSGCAIVTMNDEKSRSLEDMLRIWERRNDFLDLGAETLETGDSIRDFLFLDSDFLKKNEERLRGFDEKIRIEYGLGVVTIIGDRMKDSPGVASAAIGAIKGMNIKRGIFAPHTSQIIIVVEERNVNEALAAIHKHKNEMDQPRS